VDGNTTDAGQAAEAGGNCDAAAADPPDDQGLDENCDGADGIVGTDVYVDGTAGSDTNVGSPDKPFQSIGAALERAQTRDAVVLLRAGNYEASTLLDVAGTWSVYGGYGKGFVGAPKRDVTVLKADSTGLFLSKAERVRFAHLTIQGAPASPMTGPTAHGLRLSVSEAMLDDVVVSAGDGRAGDAGKVGEPGKESLPTSSPGSSVKCDDVALPQYAIGVTTDMANGSSQPGNFAKSLAAQPGGAGNDGTGGADAPSGPVVTNGLIVGLSASPGQSNGIGGWGGPGGGSGTIMGGTYNGSYFWGGRGGDGGCPGRGGTGGQSGGSSVAVLVLGGKLTVARSLFVTGFAGNGGEGGAGGPGGPGKLGDKPNTFSSIPFVDPPCTPDTDVTRHNCAGYGGTGGPGGKGGHGGGGGGGWTIGIAIASGAVATIDALTQYKLGATGAGGMGGLNLGPDGQRRSTYQVPKM